MLAAAQGQPVTRTSFRANSHLGQQFGGGMVNPSLSSFSTIKPPDLQFKISAQVSRGVDQYQPPIDPALREEDIRIANANRSQ